MMKELDEVLSSWTSKIPGVSNNKEITMAKQMHKTVSSVMSVVGVDATVDDLDKMTRTDRLQAAVQSEQSVEEINMFIQQFSTASLMHRVLRKRKLEGKRIPETPEAMQEVIQTEGKSVLTRTQKEKLKKQAHKSMRKSMR
jgi:TusA-related sulfurtransferase